MIKKTIHNNLINEIAFIHENKKCVLHLTPTQALEDQIQMKKKVESEKLNLKFQKVDL